MLNNIILTTPLELESLIQKAVNDALINHQISTPNKEPPQKEFFNIQEASEYLNLAVPTIYSLVSKREIPSIKRGKKLAFKVSELREYLEKGKRKTVDEIIENGEKNQKRK